MAALSNLPKKRDDIHLEKRLGKGFFGEVHKATEVAAEKRTFAVKKVGLALIEQNRLTEQLRREIDILYALKHNRIVTLHFDFNDKGSMYLGMEFASGGSLFDKLNQQARGFPPELASRFFFETCEALDYLHHLPEKVIHRDIKPENILLDGEDHIKLADFGWANLIPADHPSRDTFCGTLDYLPPEMIMGTGHDESADMWNMGVLSYELTTGKSPFGSDSKEKTCRLILSVDLRFPADLDADARDLVVNLCKKKPAERLAVRDAMKHRFVTKFAAGGMPKSSEGAADDLDAADGSIRPSFTARLLQKDYEKQNGEMQQLLSAKQATEDSLVSISAELESINSEIKKEHAMRKKVEASNAEVSKRVSSQARELEELRRRVESLRADVVAPQCSTAGCCREPWNGQQWEACCRTCSTSVGKEHGPECNRKASSKAAAFAGGYPSPEKKPSIFEKVFNRGTR